MSLREAHTAVRIMEASDNFARADGPLLTHPEEAASDAHTHYYDNDAHFWERILADPAAAWGREVAFYYVVLSEWVPRVPGLFWTQEARKLRGLAEEKVAYVSENWRVYLPRGKSEKVMGGIGTFRMSPAADGTRLVAFTTTMNASAGVPALVSPDVWAKIGERGPHEGQLLHGQGRWQSMAEGWAARFRSTRDIPRGYLIVDDPDAIEPTDEQLPTQFHPFTVMEYYSGSKELFDYVYATGDTAYGRCRQRIMEFFDTYKDEQERYGRYLLAGDMVDPLWEADYDTPAALRHADPSAKSQLELLEERVRESLLGEDNVERLLEALGATSESVEDVRRLSLDIGIQPAVWLRGGSLAEVCSQFLEEVLRRGKLEELVEIFAMEYTDLIA